MNFLRDSGRSGNPDGQDSACCRCSPLHPARPVPTAHQARCGTCWTSSFARPRPQPPNDVGVFFGGQPKRYQSPLKTLRERLMAHADNKVCRPCLTRSGSRWLSLAWGSIQSGYRTDRRTAGPFDVSAAMRAIASPAPRAGTVYHDNPRIRPALREASILHRVGSEVRRSAIFTGTLPRVPEICPVLSPARAAFRKYWHIERLVLMPAARPVNTFL